MRSTERLKPMARRSSSASPPLKPAIVIAIRSSCSWNRGNTEGAFEYGGEVGMGVGHVFAPRTALEIGPDHVARDRPGADDGDRDD